MGPLRPLNVHSISVTMVQCTNDRQGGQHLRPGDYQRLRLVQLPDRCGGQRRTWDV